MILAGEVPKMLYLLCKLPCANSPKVKGLAFDVTFLAQRLAEITLIWLFLAQGLVEITLI